MAKYKQRKDGRYQTSVTIDGKKKWVTANSSDELDKKITEIKYLGNKGVILNNNDITLGEFCDKWLKINSIGKEEGTIKEYKYIINDYIKPNLGHKKIKSIKLYDIQEIVNSLITKGHTRTARRFLIIIRKILNEAVQNDLILKNVATYIKNPTHKAKEKIPLTTKEDKLLIECSKIHKHGLFFLLIRYTGIRKEEAAAIKIDDIDMKNKVIHINKAISFTTNQGKEKSTKNKKDRNIYILDIFKPLLEYRVNYCKEHNITFLFTKQTNPNEKLSDSAIKRMLESFLLCMNQTNNKKVDLDKIPEIKFTLHQLRHSFCTMLYYCDVGIKEAQDLMGHSSASMVYDIYTHLDKTKENTFDKINNSTKMLM